jgi:hypothetical protein
MNSYQLSRDKMDKENKIIQEILHKNGYTHPPSNQYPAAKDMSIERKKNTGPNSHTSERRPEPSQRSSKILE